VTPLLVPQRLQLEVTRRCNSRCLHCAHDPSWRGDMPLSMVARILDELPTVRDVHPYKFGEPLLHPRFLDIVRMLKDRGRRVALYTNGSLLSGALRDGLAEMLDEDDMLSFSVEGSDRQTYEHLRRGLSWDVLIENVDAWQAVKRAKSEARLTAVRESDAQRDLAFWSGRVDQAWAVPEEPFGRPVRGHFDIRFDSRTCHETNEDMAVLYNGDVVMCCGDCWGKFPVGNVRDGALAAWNSPAMTRCRSEAQEICSHCLAQWVNEEASPP